LEQDVARSEAFASPIVAVNGLLSFAGTKNIDGLPTALVCFIAIFEIVGVDT
jgi:hypothetical protein